MNTTSPTLLDHLRQGPSPESWLRFVQLYAPLLTEWAGRLGVQDADAADLVQDVFIILLQKMRAFQYDRDKSFRAWLRTILRNKWRESQRRRVPAPVGADSGPLGEVIDANGQEELTEEEYRRHLVGRALQLIQGDFDTATWTAWTEYVIRGRPAAEAAVEAGCSVHAVYLTKARVLRRLRQELDGFLD